MEMEAEINVSGGAVGKYQYGKVVESEIHVDYVCTGLNCRAREKIPFNHE